MTVVTWKDWVWVLVVLALLMLGMVGVIWYMMDAIHCVRWCS